MTTQNTSKGKNKVETISTISVKQSKIERVSGLNPDKYDVKLDQSIYKPKLKCLIFGCHTLNATLRDFGGEIRVKTEMGAETQTLPDKAFVVAICTRCHNIYFNKHLTYSHV